METVKTLTIKVTSCFGCPWYRTPSDDRVKIDWCYASARVIEDINNIDIPEWCTLPDKEDE